ncbi:MAG: Aspartyl/glutamyl-tRNA(Asn/Gln) amidotransferase subunit C [candidate division WS6 bacterium GW2011_GWE1_34_7]|uniref:Aspartyl/glutamyl-tRNA(Asn/Gln) amidotransferase subunit C n=1 Tax=candidate division WS6 bacterium GW2011_GWE1_34_7 TaxID=1619093 RepID=A0A0G0DL01_9BACT|nr:MAG: Aspartyl/glutamyl-tRNA(Asn/Gln) amidotransferase subunit C [candidate division WS6 bacterium GW2011_GWE1_34_7]
MDKQTLKHIAELSRINLTDQELEKFTPQMETILDSAKQLQKIDTKGVSPMKRHVPFSDLREDIPQKSLTQEDVLKNAKYKENGHIKVYGKIFGSIEES